LVREAREPCAPVSSRSWIVSLESGGAWKVDESVMVAISACCYTVGI
jgi:hypothetical protein